MQFWSGSWKPAKIPLGISNDAKHLCQSNGMELFRWGRQSYLQILIQQILDEIFPLQVAYFSSLAIEDTYGNHMQQFSFIGA